MHDGQHSPHAYPMPQLHAYHAPYIMPRSSTNNLLAHLLTSPRTSLRTSPASHIISHISCLAPLRRAELVYYTYAEHLLKDEAAEHADKDLSSERLEFRSVRATTDAAFRAAGHRRGTPWPPGYKG